MDASFGSPAILSSQAVRDNPRRPKGTGDDPFTLADLGPVDKKDDDLGLEGSPPDRYDGDLERTTKFLTQSVHADQSGSYDHARPHSALRILPFINGRT